MLLLSLYFYTPHYLLHKVDLSNEDHCGPCGQYALSKGLGTNLKINSTSIKNEKNR